MKPHPDVIAAWKAAAIAAEAWKQAAEAWKRINYTHNAWLCMYLGKQAEAPLAEWSAAKWHAQTKMATEAMNAAKQKEQEK